MQIEKLVYMANQIESFFKHDTDAVAVAEIEAHLKNFWERRMLQQMFAHLDAGGAGLHERTRLALERLHHVQS